MPMITLSCWGPTTPIAEREALLARSLPPHAVRVATCDRVEWYQGTGIPTPETSRHLFRLASGLESPLLGENQILHQVKSAYLQAASSGMLDQGMHRLFQGAFHCAKKVRNTTGIAKGALGHALGVVRLLEQEFGNNLSQQPVMIIGVNNLNRSILKYLRDRGNRLFFLGNRTFGKAQELAHEFGGTAFGLGETGRLMGTCSILISATSAPHFVVHPHHMSHLAPQEGPRVLVDLAVPRDIDPALGCLPGRTLYNHHQLETLLQHEHHKRRACIPHAEAIISRELEIFHENLSRRFTPKPIGTYPNPGSPVIS